MSAQARLRERASHFAERFGEPHLHFAWHAAFPLVLTPDLLYHLWASFPVDVRGEPLRVPWLAVADLLLSDVCRPAGRDLHDLDLYEMDPRLRAALLGELESAPRFGLARLRELANFLDEYISAQAYFLDPEMEDLTRVQRWNAQVYLTPATVGEDMARYLADPRDESRYAQVAHLCRALAVPLGEHAEPLLRYARGMAALSSGREDQARTELLPWLDQETIRVAGVELAMPAALRQEPDQAVQQAAESSASSPQEEGSEPDDAGPENGYWILLDGTDEYSLPPYHNLLAAALGRVLAHAGFSLLTLGGQGVAHVAAREFWLVLEKQGYSSGIYRLLHLVADNQRADFGERGRTLFPGAGEPVVAAAIRRSDAVLSIGGSRKSAEVAEAARRAGVPSALLVDASGRDHQKLVAGAPELVPPAPTEWTPRTAEEFAVSAVRLLRVRLRVPSAGLLQDAARFVQLAALALDRRHLVAYNRDLRALKRDAISVGFIAGLATDPRRPSHRLVGYVAGGMSLGSEELLAALRAEQRTMQDLWETRTLWLALALFRDIPSLARGEYARPLAAACASIALDLEANPRIDPSRQCRELLETVVGLQQSAPRASELAHRAAEYMELRRTTPPGDYRTARMEQLVNQIAKLAVAPSTLEAEVWFGSCSAGQRVVALALLLGASDPAGYPLVERAIGAPYSPFEQYTALRVVIAVFDRLHAEDLRRLRGVLEAQRGGPPGVIDQSDSSRWKTSSSLLERISTRLSGLSEEALPQVDWYPPQHLKIAQGFENKRKDRWDWWIWIDGPEHELDQIKEVIYTLHRTFPNHVRTVRDRGSRFKLTTNGWGTFRIYARVVLKDGNELKLEHDLKLY